MDTLDTLLEKSTKRSLGSSKSNKDKAIALLNSIETGDVGAIRFVNENRYRQHNLSVADGLSGFAELLQQLPEKSAKVNVVRAFEDGDFVVTHSDYNLFGPKVGFDIFKFEDGLIVEHWDNLDEKIVQPNPSGRTQLDGSTAITDLEKTDTNKNIVKLFVNAVLMNKAYDQAARFINSECYLQHNAQIADGLIGLQTAIESLANSNIAMDYTICHAILGEGNFVLAVSEGTFGEKQVSYYDLFRLEDGKIVEHWDVIEPILPKSEWKNSNGKFAHL